MKILYTQTEFNTSKTEDKLPLKCCQCSVVFYKEKKHIINVLNLKRHEKGKYCSSKCYGESRNIKINVECACCNIGFKKSPHEIKKTKNNFCSRSCSATYNNKHKKHGTRRSKLEVWLEEQLPIKYPDLNFVFNGKKAIESELDIYIPSLNLAFELNGIFHYEPIFGKDKFDQIQNNDRNKYKACIDEKIDLCIIDTSQQKYFKPSSSQKYFNIITKIIQERHLT